MKIWAKSALPPETEGVTTIYKDPLEPVKKGYGYRGVLTTNKEKTHLQCHICGYFFEALGGHVSQAHKIKADQYRLIYELALSTPLVSEKTRNTLIEARSNLSGDQKLKIGAILKANRGKAPKGNHGYHKTLEDRNRQGRCPNQLLDKVEELAKKLERSPAFNEFIAEYGDGMMHAIQNTFGKWSTAKNIVGLEVYTQGAKPYYSKDGLIDVLRSFKEVNGRKAVLQDAKLGLIPSHFAFKRTMGSWAKAKALAYNKGEI